MALDKKHERNARRLVKANEIVLALDQQMYEFRNYLDGACVNILRLLRANELEQQRLQRADVTKITRQLKKLPDSTVKRVSK